MGYLRGACLAMFVVMAVPLLAIGFAARFARSAVEAGYNSWEDAWDWIDSK